MTKRCRAFSLPELLVVFGIIALVAAILNPALVAAKEQGKRTVCVENMHSMYVATEIYRQDYENVSYGPAEDMGLPLGDQRFVNALFRTYKCPDARPDRTVGISYMRLFVDSEIDQREETWATWVLRQEDRTLMYVDAFHNDIDVPLTDDNYITRFVLGVDLGGTLRKERKAGDWMQFSWWSS